MLPSPSRAWTVGVDSGTEFPEGEATLFLGVSMGELYVGRYDGLLGIVIALQQPSLALPVRRFSLSAPPCVCQSARLCPLHASQNGEDAQIPLAEDIGESVTSGGNRPEIQPNGLKGLARV